MKIFTLPKLLAALGLLAAANLSAQTFTRYEAIPLKGKVRIEGTSTVRDWTVECGTIAGYVELDSGFSIDPAQKAPAPGKVNARAEITIRVRQIKSGTKGMDVHMHDTLKEKQNPQIQYRLLEMTLKETPKPGSAYLFDTKGTLTVAGVTRTNSMVVTMAVVEQNKLKFTGTTPLKMTDFGMTPPSPPLVGGLIKTGDDVKIIFDWLTAIPPKTAAAAPKTP